MNCATAIINLSALKANYRLLAGKAHGAECAAVVKANAYGLGIERVAPALWEAGARFFYVATMGEGAELRALLPEAEIGVFYGVEAADDVAMCHAHRLIPVLNSFKGTAWWRKAGQGAPCIVHIDTGMKRLGIEFSKLSELSLDGLNVRFLMTHLACAGDAGHPLNALQLKRVQEIRAKFPAVPFSFANSSGIFLGAEFHGNQVRPGIAIYGSNPTPNAPNPMQTVLTLQAPILNMRTLKEAEPVGYNASVVAPAGSRLATLGIGYADGLPRSLTHHGKALISGHIAPMIGIVSMDLTIVDVSALPDVVSTAGGVAELIGEHMPIDKVAETAGTIAYEILTRLGNRLNRVYLNE